MSKVPSVGYRKVINALRRDGWVVVRQKDSHIRLQKHLHTDVLKLTVPAHNPIKCSTLSHILKQARLSTQKFAELLYAQCDPAENAISAICITP